MKRSLQRRWGFTLVEVILAVTITAMVCAAGAMAIKAISDSWQTNNGVTETVNSARNAVTRLRTVLKQARMVGYSDEEAFVFWSGDDNGDFKINYNEAMMVRYNASTKTLELHDVYFPPYTPSSDMDSRTAVLSPSDLCSQATAELLGGLDKYVRVRPLAYEITRFDLSLDASGPNTRFVELTFTVDRNGVTQEFHVVTTLRSRADYLLD